MIGEGAGKVIFVGGTSFSGSTMLDMILANDGGGFSCGEVEALFYPFRPHHIDPPCGCGESGCDIWQSVYRNGVKRLHWTIFKRFPEKRFIVDSSKSPLWIRENARRLQRQGVTVRHILIWKTPEAFRRSRAKRGSERGWLRAWVNYHRQYFSFVGAWKAIPYADLINDPQALESVCRWLGIPWYLGKERYWERRHHTLFGNTTAKIHLYRCESNAYQRSRQELLSTIDGFAEGAHATYRTILRTTPPGDEDPWTGDRRIEGIVRVLRDNDVRDAATELEADCQGERLALPGLYTLYRNTRQYVGSLPFRAAARWVR